MLAIGSGLFGPDVGSNSFEPVSFSKSAPPVMLAADSTPWGRAIAAVAGLVTARVLVLAVAASTGARSVSGA
jgi:hypothetical protein